MEQSDHICCVRSKDDLSGAFKTIHLFLENQNFHKTCACFKKECYQFGYNIPKLSGSVKLLRSHQSSKDGSNYSGSNNQNQESFILESSYREGKPQQDGRSISRKTTSTNLIESGNIPSDLPQYETVDRITNYDKYLGGNYEGLNNESRSYHTLKSSFNNLKDEHQKLIAVTAELTSALQQNIKGQAKNYQTILDNCKCIYPSLFEAPNENQSDNQSIREIARLKSDFSRGQSSTPTSLMSSSDEEPRSKMNLQVSFTNIEPVPTSQTQLSQKSSTLSPMLGSKMPLDSRSYTVMAGSESNDMLDADYCDDNTCSVSDIELSRASTDNVGCGCEHDRPVNNNNTSIYNQINLLLDHIFQTATRTPSPRSDIFESKHMNYLFAVPNNSPRDVDILNVIEEASEETDRVESYATIKSSASAIASPVTSEDRKYINFSLDYKKLKEDLLYGSDSTKMKLLRALRWRITKNHRLTRNIILSDYIYYDLLNLHSKEHNLARQYFNVDEDKTSEELFECFARLVNTIASFTQGRDYLLSKTSFLDTILLPTFLNENKIPSLFSRDMLIATLQKLSLRKGARLRMIDAGLTEYLVDFLNKYHNLLSDYALEYGAALLMNLSLEKEARQVLKRNPKVLIELLKTLLQQHDACLPYVNGTFFSVLTEENIRSEAPKQGLEQCVVNKIDQLNDVHLKKQLEIILKNRLRDNIEPFINDNNDQEVKEEVDLLETELDQGDRDDSLNEEDLLEKYKLQGGSRIRRTECLCRPITPATIRLKSTKKERDLNLGRQSTRSSESSSPAESVHDEQPAYKSKNGVPSLSKKQLQPNRLQPKSSSAPSPPPGAITPSETDDKLLKGDHPKNVITSPPSEKPSVKPTETTPYKSRTPEPPKSKASTPPPSTLPTESPKSKIDRSKTTIISKPNEPPSYKSRTTEHPKSTSPPRGQQPMSTETAHKTKMPDRSKRTISPTPPRTRTTNKTKDQMMDRSKQRTERDRVLSPSRLELAEKDRQILRGGVSASPAKRPAPPPPPPPPPRATTGDSAFKSVKLGKSGMTPARLVASESITKPRFFDRDRTITNQSVPKFFREIEDESCQKQNCRHHHTRNTMVTYMPMNSFCYMDIPCKIMKEGESRYSCHCYEAMQEEVKDIDISSCIQPNNLGSTSSKKKEVCEQCLEEVCECAFEPRPKLSRTPP